MSIALESQEVLLYPKELDLSETKYRIIQLSNPSLIEGKKPLQILIHEEDDSVKIYHFDQYAFRSKYLVDASQTPKNKKIDGSKPQDSITSARSIFLINEQNRKDGLVFNQDYLKLLLPYDITYSLISAYIQDMKDPVSLKEADYLKESQTTSNNKNEDRNFLTVRDYRDKLIERDSIEWNHVPLTLISEKLSLISEEITECDEQYYKITLDHIVKYLITHKIKSIYKKFPSSIPIPTQWPEDIQQCMKIVRICQLLISLIPKRVYQSMIEEDSLNLELNAQASLTVKQCYDRVLTYKKSTAVSDEEKKLLAQTAMQVGLSNSTSDSSSNGRVKKPVAKKVVPKKRVQVGKGAIDGFFKRR